MAVQQPSSGSTTNAPSPQTSQAQQESAALREQIRLLNEKAAASQNKSAVDRDTILGDVAAGQDFAKSIIGNGSLGRIRDSQNVRDDNAQIRELRMKALGGLTGEEMQAERDQAKNNINRATQTQLRGLRGAQAASGVRGSSAVAQQAGILGEGANRQADFERDLMLQQRGVQQQALDSFAGNTQQRQASDRELNQFNLSQAANEKFAQLSTGFGFGQLGVTARAGEQAAAAQEKAAAASGGCFKPDTEIKMKDGSWMKIQDIKMLDHTVGGIVSALSVHLIKGESIFDYQGDTFSGDHLVLVGDEFQRVKNLEDAKQHHQAMTVYNIAVTDHVIITRSGNLTSDMYEVDEYSMSDAHARLELNKRVEEIKKKYL